MSTGSNTPWGGYDGYTARYAGFDTVALVSKGKMRADCRDLRLFQESGDPTTWTQLDREILFCNSASTEVRFRLQADIEANGSYSGYYLYYGNPSPGLPPASPNNVYLWYDTAAANQLSSYILGGPLLTFFYDERHAVYSIKTGEDVGGSMHLPLNERDAYIEAEFFHLGCYADNMHAGVGGRLLGSEPFRSSHFYRSLRGHQAACGLGYENDGDNINASGATAVDGINPPAIVVNQFRKQGVALSSVNPTRATFWDSDTVAGFGPRGWPTVSPIATGTDSEDHQSPGGWGLYAFQDTVRVRNILVRRYIYPEPRVSQGAEVSAFP